MDDQGDTPAGPPPGTRVTVATGKWVGRVGTLIRYETVPAGTRVGVMPVVDLDPDGPRKARTVRVKAVLAGSYPHPPEPVVHLPCGCNRNSSPERTRRCDVHTVVHGRQERLWQLATFTHRQHAIGDAAGGFTLPAL